MILMNTYHLWLAPGIEQVAAAGGLHAYTGWEQNILTDSGGYQVVSLARTGSATVDEAGAVFDAPDGRRVLSPETAIEVQEALAPDVAMTLDQPVLYPVSMESARNATERTHRWAARCIQAWTRGATELFGIVQGGFDLQLRQESARVINAMGFPGYGIGGLSLGEPVGLGHELLLSTTEALDVDKPRYLMGVGSEPELLRAIGAGVDLFDCVWPTRLARTGTVLVGSGRINLRSASFAAQAAPIEPDCGCPACTGYSRAALRLMHLRGSLLGHRLCTLHNLQHTLDLVRRARAAILDRRFDEFAAERVARPPA
jgi:queuine tRNA-ribosyltransferase